MKPLAVCKPANIHNVTKAKILQVQLPISPKCNHKQEALLNNENIFYKFVLLYVHGSKNYELGNS